MTICASCAAPNPSRPCNCCQSVRYCNRACQRAHSKSHKRDRAEMAIMAAVVQHIFGNGFSAGGNAIPSGRSALSSGGTAPSSGDTSSSSGGSASSSSGNASSSTAQDTQEFNPGDQDTKPYTAISKNLFFHDRLESNTFQLLIDTLRMRQQDELNFDRVRMPGSIHARNNPSSERAFRDFILRAQAVPGYLPTWWKGEISTDACVEYCKQEC